MFSMFSTAPFSPLASLIPLMERAQLLIDRCICVCLAVEPAPPSAVAAGAGSGGLPLMFRGPFEKGLRTSSEIAVTPCSLSFLPLQPRTTSPSTPISVPLVMRAGQGAHGARSVAHRKKSAKHRTHTPTIRVAPDGYLFFFFFPMPPTRTERPNKRLGTPRTNFVTFISHSKQTTTVKSMSERVATRAEPDEGIARGA